MKIKFSNKLSPGVQTVNGKEVRVLSCQNQKEYVFHTDDSCTDIRYKFNKNSSLLVHVETTEWNTVEDLGSMIEFLKAAKKRAEKIALKREQRSGGF